ncbi:MAG: hypothetical protein D6797_08230 [Bdellovibrio sp.]|nr:MAG: hypothetical protein D6797_08230 [Bdellovibrio sp.]
MDVKKILILAVTVIFLGEMLYQLFISAPAAPKTEQGAELFTAIMKARVSAIDSILTKDKKVVEDLKKLGCSSINIAGDYSIECPANITSVEAKNANIKYRIVIENVTTVRGTMPAYQEVKIGLPFKVSINDSVELKGTVSILNSSIVTISPTQIYSRVANATENATIEKVYRRLFNYSVPFEERHLYDNYTGAEISDIVLTTAPRETGYVKNVGVGYIVVEESMNNKTELLQDFPDATIRPSYIESSEKLDIPLNYTAVTEALLNTSLGLYNATLPGEHYEGEKVAIHMSIEKSGDVILNKSISIIKQGSSPVAAS